MHFGIDMQRRKLRPSPAHRRHLGEPARNSRFRDSLNRHSGCTRMATKRHQQIPDRTPTPDRDRSPPPSLPSLCRCPAHRWRSRSPGDEIAQPSARRRFRRRPDATVAGGQYNACGTPRLFNETERLAGNIHLDALACPIELLQLFGQSLRLGSDSVVSNRTPVWHGPIGRPH